MAAPEAGDPRGLDAAVAWLRSGGIVAFPTDTFYGLAADPRSDRAVLALFDLKGRDHGVALPLVAASRDQVEACCGVLDGASARLAQTFWPGPLSLILDAPAAVTPLVQGGTGTVAIRVPAHPLARALAGAFGYVLTATSANLSGRPPAATAAAIGVLGADARVFVLDGGRTAGGAASTIVDARTTPPRLVRAGAIAWDRVLEFSNE